MSPVLADYRVPQPELWHTIVIPLGPSEDPPAGYVSWVVVQAFGHLPFADARLPIIEWEIKEEKNAAGIVELRTLVGRFPKWSSDPAPNSKSSFDRDHEEYRLAMLSKGKI